MFAVQPDSLDWALAHAEAHGDTDVFPIPFEYGAIRYDWNRLRQELATADLEKWTVRPHRRLLAPKARYGFRVITQLDPIDFLLFSAVVYEVAATLENHRVPAAQQTVFAFRVQPTPAGQLFDPTIGYASFQAVSREVLNRETGFSHVVLADIADFYPRIYLHRLENALNAAGASQQHVRAIMRFLSGWNGTETFGVPVGGAASRILAESSIADVDSALLAFGTRFCRFNDDYRIFCHSYEEAYRKLCVLADSLFRAHGLTLQPSKTAILARADFETRFLTSYEDHEVRRLRDQFQTIVRGLRLGSRYEPIIYDRLPQRQKEQIDQLNLSGLFAEEIARGEGLDLSLIRFALRRLAQLGDRSIVDPILDNLPQLHPAFPDIIEYFRTVRGLDAPERARIGGRLLDLLGDNSILGLEYYRMWALRLFAESTDWDNDGRFLSMLADARDQASRRKLILALGRSRQRHWFQAQWRDVFNEPPWPRRAAIASASCLPRDARKHWYDSIRPRLDTLEKAVASWAHANPFA